MTMTNLPLTTHDGCNVQPIQSKVKYLRTAIMKHGTVPKLVIERYPKMVVPAMTGSAGSCDPE